MYFVQMQFTAYLIFILNYTVLYSVHPQVSVILKWQMKILVIFATEYSTCNKTHSLIVIPTVDLWLPNATPERNTLNKTQPTLPSSPCLRKKRPQCLIFIINEFLLGPILRYIGWKIPMLFDPFIPPHTPRNQPPQSLNQWSLITWLSGWKVAGRRGGGLYGFYWNVSTSTIDTYHINLYCFQCIMAVDCKKD